MPLATEPHPGPRGSDDDKTPARRSLPGGGRGRAPLGALPLRRPGGVVASTPGPVRMVHRRRVPRPAAKPGDAAPLRTHALMRRSFGGRCRDRRGGGAAVRTGLRGVSPAGVRYFRRRTDLPRCPGLCRRNLPPRLAALRPGTRRRGGPPLVVRRRPPGTANHDRASRRFSRLVGRLAGQTASDPPRPETVDPPPRVPSRRSATPSTYCAPTTGSCCAWPCWEEVPRRLAGLCRCTPHALSQRIQRAEARLARHLAAASGRRKEQYVFLVGPYC